MCHTNNRYRSLTPTMAYRSCGAIDMASIWDRSVIRSEQREDSDNVNRSACMQLSVYQRANG